MALGAKFLRTAILSLFTLHFSHPVFAADPNHRLNEYACLKQEYRVCRNLNDMRSILEDVTQLDAAHIDEQLRMVTNRLSGEVEELSTLECQAHLVFAARSLQLGLSKVDPDICAARGISEFVLTHSWVDQTWVGDPSIAPYSSTVRESLQILNDVYLGDWAAIRSTEGSKIAQCFQFVTLIKTVFDDAEKYAVVEKRNKYRIGEVGKLAIDNRILIAIGIARAAASGEHGNTYSKFLIDSINTLMPDLISKGTRNPLLEHNESDVLCPAQTLE